MIGRISKQHSNKKVILVSEGSNKYTYLYLVEMEYFGFNTLESVIVE
jgi:hypothetical protein